MTVFGLKSEEWTVRHVASQSRMRMHARYTRVLTFVEICYPVFCCEEN